MKVLIRRIPKKEEEQVIIECVEVNSDVKDIRNYVLSKEMELSGITQAIILPDVPSRWF